MKCFLYAILVLLLLNSCVFQQHSNQKELVNAFYSVYNQRKDIASFLAFYDDSIVIEDIINGDRIEGKENLRKFFDWGNPDFECLEPSYLVIREQVIDEDKAVVRGYFSRFRWGMLEFERMHFTTILTFNEQQKIIYQTDWINYPSELINCEDRKNANDWLK